MAKYNDPNTWPVHLQVIRNKKEENRTVEEHALLRLWVRGCRLVRLLELDAPKVVLANEAALLAKSGILLDRKSFSMSLFDAEVRRFRDMAGYCYDLDCPKKAEPLKEGEPAHFDGMCAEHKAKQAETDAEIDGSDDEPSGLPN